MTLKQTKALQNMVENGGISAYRAMRMAGYSHAMARNPHKFTRSPRVSEYLSERGITPEKAISSISDALDNGSILNKLAVARFCLKL